MSIYFILNGTVLTFLFLFAALLAVTDRSTVTVTVTGTNANVTGTTVTGTTSIATMSDGSDSDERSMIFDGKNFVSSRLLQAEEWKDVEHINLPWLDGICFDLGTQDSSSSSSSGNNSICFDLGNQDSSSFSSSGDLDSDDTDDLASIVDLNTFASASAEYDVEEDAACEDTDNIDFDDKEKDDETPAAAAEIKGSSPPTKNPQLPKRIFQPDMKLYRKKVLHDPSDKYTLDRDKFIKDFGENWEELTRNQKIAYTHVLLFFDERTSHPESCKGRYGEWHHILPKSLGGSDDDENMMWLECGENFFLIQLFNHYFILSILTIYLHLFKTRTSHPYACCICIAFQ